MKIAYLDIQSCLSHFKHSQQRHRQLFDATTKWRLITHSFHLTAIHFSLIVIVMSEAFLTIPEE